MKVLLVLCAFFLSLTSTVRAGSVLNPEELGGVGVLHVTPIVQNTDDPFFPSATTGYEVVLNGCAVNSDSVAVLFDAVVTDSTYFRMDGHDDVWTSVQFRDNCLVTIRATWERDGHRLVALDVGLLSIFPTRRPRLQ